MNLIPLRFGDIVVRRINALANHYAIFIGEYNGVNSVIENQAGFGIRIIPYSQFLAEGKFVRVEPKFLTIEQRFILIKRISLKQQVKYDWYSYNCEHYVNEMITGKAFSTQIEKWKATGVLLTALTILFSLKK